MLKTKGRLIASLIHTSLFSIFLASSLIAQNSVPKPVVLDPDGKERLFQIKVGEEPSFTFVLEKGRRYLIRVEQKGIDLVIRLNDPDGTLIKEQDSPNGNFGPETIFFEPEVTGRFSLSVTPLAKSRNPSAGPYSINLGQAPPALKAYTLAQTRTDFDLLVRSLKESHAGLDWYSTYREFDDFCAIRRKLLHDKMTALDFFRVIAPIVAFTREGHTAVRLSAEDTSYLQAFGRYLPFQVKFINKRPFVINDFDGIRSKGLLLTRINGKSIAEIIKTFLSIEPDDGYIVTGKYRWIEENGAFPWYYLRCFGDSATFSVELTDPNTNRRTELNKVRAVRYSEYRRLWRESTPSSEYDFPPAKIEFRPEMKTAILTFNKFDTLFKGTKFDFKTFTKNSFDEISNRGIENLIIDIRKNSGGEEGLEDYVFAYLTNKPYIKYRYVQALATTFSFLDFTNYSTKERQARLETALKDEFYVDTDGRYLRKTGFMPVSEPHEDAYLGKLFVLTGGLTYSGGSEFASIVKAHRQGIFIGEETGGGYYGNTSGKYLILTLPNTRVFIRIPLLKFVVDVGGSIPFGRGVIPDYEIEPTLDEYLNGIDAALNFTLNLIQRSKSN